MKTYPKPLRIFHHKVGITPTKRYLSPRQIKLLLNGKVYIEEKIDGSQCGIAVKGGKPIFYTKNRHLFEFDKTPTFRGAWKWLWENLDKIEKIPKRHRICGEWVYVQHHIHYDSLPSFFMAFDVLNEQTDTLLSYKDKIKIFDKCGFSYAPLVSSGMYTMDEIYDLASNISNFSTVNNMEGVVIKSDKTSFSGKLVMQEFLDDIMEERSPLE